MTRFRPTIVRDGTLASFTGVVGADRVISREGPGKAIICEIYRWVGESRRGVS
ncbi:MAG TPA: hypothetical protein PLL50_04270 [Propionicimonas sp.]|nr:hypothetical protein [Propionicimonas sp.]HQA77555.1 hypothetical protein [Propionicimonas sp.]HQD96512.1 hypothetical protein [Propionicimonas sp.]